MEIYQDKKWLEEQYVGQGKSTNQIASEIKRSCSTVYRWLIIHDIPTRKHGYASSPARKNNVVISDSLLCMLEGELLGDGSLAFTASKQAAIYTHGSKYQQYLQWLSKKFEVLGLKQCGNIIRGIYRKKEKPGYNISWYYKTVSYKELAGLRRRWYPNGKKAVPGDFILTPTAACQWYIGDGGLKVRRDGRARIELCTDAFDPGSIRILMDQLLAHGLKITCNKRNRICIGTNTTEKFLEWIGPCPPKIAHIYAYKWDVNRTCTIPEWQEQYKLQHNKSLEEADRCAQGIT